jgi:hypothetical protein
MAERSVPGLWSLDMRDDNVFDAWIDLNNVSDHTHELLEALARHYEAMGALLPDEAAEEVRDVLRKVDAEAWARSFGNGEERLAETRNQVPSVFFKDSLHRVDNLYFELGGFAHALYCYASSGMVEPGYRDTTRETMSTWIEGWLERANRIVETTPASVHSLDFFRLIAMGANARWALDNGRPITGDQLAALSALARNEGATSTAAYERVRKTVQNLVAEALGKSSNKDLEVLPNRSISPASAISWLREQAPDYFPSMWALPEPIQAAEAEDETAAFVFVPVASAHLHVEPKPFTPDARLEEGYVVGASSKVIGDYWEALDALSHMRTPRFRHPRAHAALGPLACQDSWVRVPRGEIEAQLAALATPGEEHVDGPTSEIVEAINADLRFRPLALGHSRKLFRFQSVRTGKAIAVEARKGPPVVYVARRDGENLPSLASSARIVGGAPSGRNSNLNSIPTFKNEELLAFRPAAASDLAGLLDHLSAA